METPFHCPCLTSKLIPCPDKEKIEGEALLCGHVEQRPSGASLAFEFVPSAGFGQQVQDAAYGDHPLSFHGGELEL